MLYRATYFLLLTIFISSCAAAGSSNAYPTYDPFAPLNGSGTQIAPVQQGEFIQELRTPLGPTPTRAAVSVTLAPRDTDPSFETPTPDAPHALPAPRELVDEYIVQPGDTLGSIARDYQVTLEALMQANALDESSILSVGVVLQIPPIDADIVSGSSFKIIPDSELVNGPATVQFDVEEFLTNRNGYLTNYVQEVDGEYISGAEIITRVAENYSVNPRLLVALVEYRSGWVTNPVPSNIDYPLGNYDNYYAGLYRQMTWTANNLNRGYYLWRAGAISTLPLSDGSYVPLDPTINAGTAGVQHFLSLFNSRVLWDTDVSSQGFFQTYMDLFGYPFDYDVSPLLPSNLTQPPMQLPIEPGASWSFTGGPHGGWDSGSAWAALDFAPPGEAAGCVSSEAWVVAAANGLIVRADNGAVVQDLDNDGHEQTGWTILYMHIEARDRVEINTYVYAGEIIGHPSCEGGFSNGTHVHLARRYNGEWIPADGNLPFNLEGWISSGNGVEYDGALTRGDTVVEAWEGVFEGLNQISK